MSQPPNPPSGGDPQQPGGGWPPNQGGNWGTDPTQQIPAGQPQYPPTQPLPAQEQYPGGGFGQVPPPGPYGQTPPPGHYLGPGQPGAGGGDYGPPPTTGGYGAPAGGSGGGRKSPVPLIIGIVAGVLAIGVVSWFLWLRPATTATPTTTTAAPDPSVGPPSVTPSVLITPSASPSPQVSESSSPRPSGTTSASCSQSLSSTQCEWAIYLRAFVQVNTCEPDASDPQGEAFTCQANPRDKLTGQATVSMRWAEDAADLTALMNDFFKRAGVPKSDLGKNWKNPPALTNWWYNDKPKEILGKLGSADADGGSGRVAWTFSKQRFFIEASSDTDDAETMVEWWART